MYPRILYPLLIFPGWDEGDHLQRDGGWWQEETFGRHRDPEDPDGRQESANRSSPSWCQGGIKIFVDLRQTDRQIDRLIDRQTDRQTDGQITVQSIELKML